MSRKARKEMMQILRDAGCDEAVEQIKAYALVKKIGKMRERIGQLENEIAEKGDAR
jgi:hypothetical protein